jgi:hypothetical protein
MLPRLARWLVSLYPRRWRDRYGDEFVVFLEDHPYTFGAAANVVGSAAAERLRSGMGFTMNWRQRTLMMMACAYLAAVAAGVNFYWTVNDTPLAVAMRSHAGLSAAFRAVALGSFFAFGTVIAIAIPLTASVATEAIGARRWNVLALIALPFLSGVLLLVWLAGSMAMTGSRWIPTPWDVTGDWRAPAEWPALETRWTLAATTFVMMVSGLVGSAAAAAAVIRSSDFARYRPSWFKATSMVFAASVIAMTVGVALWGWFAQQYAAADFHSRNGGFFSSTKVASWAMSAVVFAAASVLAIRGAADAFPARD